MSGERTSAARLAELREQLSGRELALLGHVADLRFMTGRQIEALHFPSPAGSVASSSRHARRILERLTRERMLVRLERRIGGVRAGSASFVYAIGPAGERVLDLPGPRRRYHEPSPQFLQHTLAVAEVVVDLTVASRQGAFELLTMQAEPRCWRRITAPGGTTVLRTDLHAVVGTADYEYRWFMEIDLGSEHLPTLLRKCWAYEAYYRSGVEQATHGVFPRVLWAMNSAQRVKRLRDAITADRALTPGLFTVIAAKRALSVVAGGQP